MEKLLAFHNDKKTKVKYLKRVKFHREADNLVKGKTWEDGKGCAIGCTLENYDHSQYPIELGIPEAIARLEDCIFEGLPNGESQMWPERFLKSVKVGSDLSKVHPKFLLAITQRRYEALDVKGKELVGDAIQQVIKVLSDWVEFGINEKLLSAARSAESAARSAARSAESAAWSAESEERGVERGERGERVERGEERGVYLDG